MVAVAEKRTETTASGRLEGVRHQAAVLKGPAPARFTACKQHINTLITTSDNS